MKLSLQGRERERQLQTFGRYQAFRRLGASTVKHSDVWEVSNVESFGEYQAFRCLGSIKHSDVWEVSSIQTFGRYQAFRRLGVSTVKHSDLGVSSIQIFFHSDT